LWELTKLTVQLQVEAKVNWLDVCGQKVQITVRAHYVRVIRVKCKTAKPLLYTVYRTRNRKQLGRK